MLTDYEIFKLKLKMKETHTFGATLARDIGVSRQMINYFVNGSPKAISKNIEKLLREWINE